MAFSTPIYDDEPTPLVRPGPSTGVFDLRSQLGEPAPPLLAPALAVAPTPGQGLTLTEGSKVPLSTLTRSFPVFASGDTTPSVREGTNFKTNNASATTITSFDDGREGQRIVLIFQDANTTVAETGNIKLSAAFTSTADDTMELIFDGTNWFELTRSVN